MCASKMTQFRLLNRLLRLVMKINLQNVGLLRTLFPKVGACWVGLPGREHIRPALAGHIRLFLKSRPAKLIQVRPRFFCLIGHPSFPLADPKAKGLKPLPKSSGITSDNKRPPSSHHALVRPPPETKSWIYPDQFNVL